MAKLKNEISVDLCLENNFNIDKKRIGVAALFDEKTNEIFKNIKSTLKEKGLIFNKLHPHITIGMYEDLELDMFLKWIKQFTKNHSILDIYFNHIGFFEEDMCFVAPRVDYKLLNFHKDFHLKYDNFCGELGYYYSYFSNEWSPHVTIAHGSCIEVSKSFMVLKEQFKPFKAKLVKLSVCELKPMKEITTFNLK